MIGKIELNRTPNVVDGAFYIAKPKNENKSTKAGTLIDNQVVMVMDKQDNKYVVRIANSNELFLISGKRLFYPVFVPDNSTEAHNIQVSQYQLAIHYANNNYTCEAGLDKGVLKLIQEGAQKPEAEAVKEPVKEAVKEEKPSQYPDFIQDLLDSGVAHAIDLRKVRVSAHILCERIDEHVQALTNIYTENRDHKVLYAIQSMKEFKEGIIESIIEADVKRHKEEEHDPKSLASLFRSPSFTQRSETMNEELKQAKSRIASNPGRKVEDESTTFSKLISTPFGRHLFDQLNRIASRAAGRDVSEQLKQTFNETSNASPEERMQAVQAMVEKFFEDKK